MGRAKVSIRMLPKAAAGIEEVRGQLRATDDLLARQLW